MALKQGSKVARKRYARIAVPEQVLRKAIRVLDTDDSPLADPDPAQVLSELGRYHAVFVELLTHGPLLCEEAIAREQSKTDALPLQPQAVSELRAELLAVLRNSVRHGLGGLSPGWIHTYRKELRFSTRVVNERVRIAAEGDSRSLIILQTLFLLHDVGLANVRVCQAPDCRRLVVKTYRREFCSVQCQKRTNARKQRSNKREERERRRARRRRQAE